MTPPLKHRRSPVLVLLAMLGSLLCLIAISCMAVAHVGLLGTVWLDHMYQRYYRPLIARLERTADHDAVRRTDATYYHRACTSKDLSATSAEELVLTRPDDDGDTNLADVEAAYVGHMLTHGAAIIPGLLPEELAAKLYRYVLDRNDHLTEEESIRINPNYRREAFAFDPAEDPIVAETIHTLVSNPDLKALIGGVTGDTDPALMEFTAITSYEDAEIQNWHHDVLPHRGSAVQYARTYGHTYSLFVALQDTTSDMGATRICPGTHMCGEDQGDMCSEHGFQPLLAQNDDGEDNAIWKRGDGVLINQQLAHHGEAHTEGPARVMMVVSFTTRPQLEIDHRVLSAGLFSFSLWNIWGLTWQDLYRETKSTANPWYRKLRSLGVWKPASAHWGLDFVTKSIMEWNMGENGMEPTRLSSYAKRIHRALRLPRFLQGRVIEIDEDEEEDVEEDPYHVFLTTTFQTWFDTCVRMNVALATAFLVVYAALATCFVEFRSRKPIVRVAILVYGVPTLLFFLQLRRIERSEWGQNVLNGIIFREPFPHVRQLSMLYKKLDGNIGPSTVPDRMDVLIGTRLSSPYLGSMQRWIDYHPGNVAYRSAIRDLGAYYESYQVLPCAFRESVIDRIADASRGRMLLQDWQTGFWRVMDPISTRRHIARDISLSIDKRARMIEKTLDQMMSRYRFDVSFRESSLSFHTQLLLLQCNKLLIDIRWNLLPSKKASTRTVSTTTLMVPSSRLAASLQPKVVRARPSPDSHSRWITFPSSGPAPGDTVVAPQDKGWARVTILNIHERYNSSGSMEKFFDIGYEWGDDEKDVGMHELRPNRYIVSGDPVYQCPRSTGTMSDAVIRDIHPDSRLNIAFVDNGEVREHVKANLCHKKV